jgi:hypothetical protein
MPAHKKLKHLLILVDTFSGWVEAFPTTGESEDIVSTHLINDIIPHFGLPWTLKSDNGPALSLKGDPNSLLCPGSGLEPTYPLPPSIIRKSGENKQNNKKPSKKALH